MPENYISIAGEKGAVNISENVVCVIAAAAVAEVEGVAGFSNTAGSEIYELLGKKPASKGIKASFENGGITVDVIVMVRYGYGISKAASQAQNAVISAVEAMTGITPVVNIHVSGVAFDK
jgi:uncharacterized alkaline shock family protein YloU